MNDRPDPLPRRRFFGRLLAAAAGGAWLAEIGRPRAARAEVAVDDTPYLGEIRLFAGDFAPVNWAFCEGQLLAIADHDDLFSLIGTTYGGDGTTTFALPDLRGRLAVHPGNGIVLAQKQGDEVITLTSGQLPSHVHTAGASAGPGTSDDPTGRVHARHGAGVPTYATSANTKYGAAALLAAGGSAPHPNMQPWLGIHSIIALYGIYPSP